MKFDFGEVLTNAWKITWKHKVLWGIAFVMMFATFLFFPLMFVPMFMILIEDDPMRWFENPLPWIGMALGFVLMMIVSYGVGPLIRSSLAVGALKAERGVEKLTFRELFSEGRVFYLRFLGVTLLFAVTFMLISFLFSAIQIFGTIVTMGLASLCLTPLTLLMYPLMFAGMAWMELTESAVVVDGLGVMDAFRRGWETMRSNKMNVFIVALVIYLGTGMISSFVVFPFFLPMFFAPVFLLEGGIPSNAFLWGAGIWMLIFFPVMAFVQGISMVFMKTGWLLTYLRLRQTPQSVVLETVPQADKETK